jgi:hypothetical protein
MFLPGEKEEDIHIETNELREKGKKIGGSNLGDCYDIIIFKDKEGDVDNLERFDAILIEPLEYVSMLIPLDFYGVICKKTTTSGKLMDGIFDKFHQVC